MTEPPGPWPQRKKERRIAQNRFASVYLDDVRFRDGSLGTHLRIDEPTGGVAIVVVDPDGHIFLHEIYRYAVDRYCLEIIRGYVDQGETPAQAALREVREEMPYTIISIGTPHLLGHIRPNSTLLTAHTPIYRVEVEPGESREARTADEDVANRIRVRSSGTGRHPRGRLLARRLLLLRTNQGT
ncbi:MAG: NUDIX hydrolase [Actinomycetota bacterium]